MYGIETLSYHAPQLWTLFLEEIKQRNTISFFKSDVNNGHVKSVIADCAVFKPGNESEIWLLPWFLWFKLELFLTNIFMIHLTERYIFNNNNRRTLKACGVRLCYIADTWESTIHIQLLLLLLLLLFHISFLLLYWGILFIKNKEYTLYIILYLKKYITITSTRSK